MSTIIEIDKAGRVVLPKKLRDALHLVPGTRLSLRLEGERLVIEPETPPRGLYMKRGTLIYDVGPIPPMEHVDWVVLDREARMKTVLGDPASEAMLDDGPSEQDVATR